MPIGATHIVYAEENTCTRDVKTNPGGCVHGSPPKEKRAAGTAKQIFMTSNSEALSPGLWELQEQSIREELTQPLGDSSPSPKLSGSIRFRAERRQVTQGREAALGLKEVGRGAQRTGTSSSGSRPETGMQ